MWQTFWCNSLYILLTIVLEKSQFPSSISTHQSNPNGFLFLSISSHIQSTLLLPEYILSYRPHFCFIFSFNIFCYLVFRQHVEHSLLKLLPIWFLNFINYLIYTFLYILWDALRSVSLCIFKKSSWVLNLKYFQKPPQQAITTALIKPMVSSSFIRPWISRLYTVTKLISHLYTV